MPTFDSLTGKLPPQSILIKRYLITRLAGRGGMSAIYQALDMQADQRKVAIKEMSQENLDDEERSEALARFQQETALLQRLNHPNLPRIYDYFNSGGRSFLVMDFIDGKTLLQLLHESNQPLPVDQVIHYAEQLCDVLAYLHAQQPPIIFRDLKPTNVMVTPQGHVYLIDFGIARLFKEGKHQDTVVLGSPGYAPPEQHGTGQTNPRSDLYALGATLHCCLTNRDPYNSSERFTFAPPHQFNPQVPPELDQLVMRLLALNEHKRPASALEVKQTLAQIRAARQAPRAVSTPATPPVPPVYAPASPVYQPTQIAAPQPAQQGPLVLSSIPDAAPRSTYQGAPAYPQHPPTRAGSGRAATLRTPVWTPGFLVVFFLVLVITLGVSFYAFNVTHPYASNPQAGLDHATEAGLAVLALIISFIMVTLTNSLLAVLITLGNIAALLVTGFAFLLQTLRDIQPSAEIFTALDTPALHQLITGGLLVASVLSLFWLLRTPFTWGDRFWIALFAIVAGGCALFQTLPQYADELDLTRHLLLLAALIVLIQTILMAGRMEHRRKTF
jgi:serine/threonine protein kinase